MPLEGTPDRPPPTSFQVSPQENGAEALGGCNYCLTVRPHRRTVPSQPPARKHWDRTAPHGPFRGGQNYGKLLRAANGLKKPTGCGHGGVTGDRCQGGRLSAIPRSWRGRGARRHARPGCQPPCRAWALGSERPRRPALRREVPSHRP